LRRKSRMFRRLLAHKADMMMKSTILLNLVLGRVCFSIISSLCNP